MRTCYLHLTRFPLQRRVIETPSLTGRPLALIEEHQGLRRVAFASSCAVKRGIHPGLTLAAATALAPELAAFPFQPLVERAALACLGEALLAVAPAFELSAPDGLWLDASAAPLWGGDEGLCRRAIALCAGLGYRAKATIASGAFTSRALARHGSKRIEQVWAHSSAEALAPLPLIALERPGVEAALASLGLTSLGEVATLPPRAVVARLGAAGQRAQRLCRGEDDTLFTPEPLIEQMEDSIALDWPAEAIEPLHFAMKTTLDRVCARLSGRRRAAVRLSFFLKLDPRGEAKVTLSLARPTASVKMLLDLAKHRIADLTLENPVAGLRIKVDEACDDPGQQLSLGDGPQGDAGLEVVLSRLATALGEDALFAAQPRALHRPERAYRSYAFRPPPRDTGLLAGTALAPRSDGAPVPEVDFERPSRLFTQPATLEAELGQGGELLGARLLGKRRRATAVAGPERLCGAWWEEAPFHRDYYRVHFEGLGPVWIFRDARDGRFYLQGLFD